MTHPWKITLSYDGTPFHGWQIQPELATVQGALAQAIRQVTGESVLPQGSGRTDTGVHALAQVASLSLACAIPADNLRRALNHALPASVRILKVEHASAGFHARHSAVRKTYEYRIFPGSGAKGVAGAVCSPMLAPYVWDCPLPLDLNRMQQAAQAVTGTCDFTSFASCDPDRSARASGPEELRLSSNIRTIEQSCWHIKDGLYVYRVTGSGFLHHMVRNLVGTFVEVGTGRLPVERLPIILAARDRSAAGPTAPARGLFLLAVDY